MQKSHHHKLFYVVRGAGLAFDEEIPCQICMRTSVVSLDSYYHCVGCGIKFHFECLEIPEFVFKKSHHIHPVVCKLIVSSTAARQWYMQNIIRILAKNVILSVMLNASYARYVISRLT